MKIFVKNTGRLLAFNVAFVSLFYFSGGDVHRLWQPYQILFILCSILIVCGWPGKVPRRSHGIDSDQILLDDFRRAVALGGTIAFLLSFTVAMENVTQDLPRVGLLIASSLPAPYWALLIYCSYRSQFSKA